jgi:O-antigen/teichoic acid export membrane protein
LRNFTETGYYAAAYKFWDTIAFVPAVIGISLYPFFAQKIAEQNFNSVREGLVIYTRYMVALAAPLAVGAFMLAPKLTIAFYGNDFLPAANALWLLVLAVALLIVYVPVNSLIVSQRTKTATKITGFNLFFNISLNLILIPKFGFVAAAAVTVCSELIQTVAYTYVVKKHIVDFPYFINFIKPSIASLIMAFVLYFLNNVNVWLSVATGGVVYIASLILMRFFNKSDYELFKDSINIRKKLEGDQV